MDQGRLRYRILTLATLVLWVLCASSAWAAPLVKNLRVGDKADHTRVVIEIEGLDGYSVESVTNPPRVVVDLKGAKWATSKSKLSAIRGKFISAARRGVPENNVLRIVLDMKQEVFIKRHFTIAPNQEFPTSRLVLDIFPDTGVAVQHSPRNDESAARFPVPPPESMKKGVPQASSDTSAKTLPNAPLSLQRKYPRQKASPDVASPAATPSVQESENVPQEVLPMPEPEVVREVPAKVQGTIPTVVIDAGHGGIDPGAKGRSGIEEKRLTFEYAVALKSRLEKDGKYKVVLTRKGDYYVNLRDRVKIAHEAKGDLFISLHADSHPNARTRGLSVYTLSEKASDREAEALARKANEEEVISGVNLTDESEDLQNLLIDMVQRDTKNNSAYFAQVLVRSLGKEARLLKNTHRFAGFVVLTGADVPSVLIELGYLSNATEDKLLRTEDYREKLVQSISKAIETYFVNREK